MICFVYKTTNLLSGKSYIGSHSTDNIDDGYLGSGVVFELAISRYGRGNFKREVLEFFEDRILAYKAEEGYIKKHGTLAPLGYNVHPFGGSYVGTNHSEETLKKISCVVRVAMSNPEVKKKLSEAAKKRSQSENNRKALLKHARSESHRMFMQEMTRNPNTQAKRVVSLKNHWSERVLTDEERREYSIRNKKSLSDPEVKRRLSLCRKGRTKSLQTRQRMSDVWVPRVLTEEGRKNIGIKGRESRVFTEEYRNRISESNKRVVHTEAWNQKVRDGLANQPVKICPHCEAICKGGNQTRYHFDKCKLKGV